MISESNYKIDLIEYEWDGVLGMAMAPGKNYKWCMERRDLKKDIDKIKNHYKMDAVVCLIEPEEMEWLGIPNELEELENAGLLHQQYPIEDMDTPGDIPRFKRLVKEVVEEYLKKGKRVMVHCQSGNGRTGLFVASCFIYQGYSPDEAIRKTRSIRRYAIESNRQENFVLNLKFWCYYYLYYSNFFIFKHQYYNWISFTCKTHCRNYCITYPFSFIAISF